MSGLNLNAVRGRMLAGARRAAALVFPPRCLACGEEIASEGGLCPSCWSDTHFAIAPLCDACGTPLPGEDRDEAALLCSQYGLRAPPRP